MKEQLAKIRSEALSAMENAQSAAELDGLRVQYLGKKGELTAVLKMMGKLSPEERPAMGQLANEVRAALETAIEEQGKRLEAKALEERLEAEAVDVTIPGKAPKLGHKHPMYRALDELKEIFIGMGFTVLACWTAPRWSWPPITSTSSTPARATPPGTGRTPSTLTRTAG